MKDRKPSSIKVSIRESGLRATPARIATLELLMESPTPLTHAEVSAELDGRGVDKATVFRNLNDLVGAGLLRRAELGDHVWRFEAIKDDGHDSSSHPHFVCIDCGHVSCVDQKKLSAYIERMSNTIGEVTEVLLRGHCNDCST